MIKLMTSFDGKPAPGGLFDPVTAIYYKACRSFNGGQHPHHFDLGGIDAPVIQKLKALGCQKIVLELPGATYEISFSDFLRNAYPVTWNDPRFPYARWYCPAVRWNSESLIRCEAPTAQEEQQTSLFNAQELQGLAQSERLAQ